MNTTSNYPDDIVKALEQLRKSVSEQIATFDDVADGAYSEEKARIILRSEIDRVRAILWKVSGATLN